MSVWVTRNGRMVMLPGSPECQTCAGWGEIRPRGYDQGAECPACDGTGRTQWTDDELEQAEEQGREGWRHLWAEEAA